MKDYCVIQKSMSGVQIKEFNTMKEAEVFLEQGTRAINTNNLEKPTAFICERKRSYKVAIIDAFMSENIIDHKLENRYLYSYEPAEENNE